MVSGLKGKDYNQKLLELGLTTLEERRHQADMIETFKIVRGFDKVDRDTWFHKASQSARATRSRDCPLNLRPQAARLDARRHFFSNRVVEDWNQIPDHIKNAITVSIFKRDYRSHRAAMAAST